MDLLNKSVLKIVSEIDPKMMEFISEAKKEAWLDHESNEETIIRVISMKLTAGNEWQWAENIFDENSERPDLDKEDYVRRLSKVANLIVNGFNLKFIWLLDNMKLSKVKVSKTKLEIEIVTGDQPDFGEEIFDGAST